MSKLTDFLSGYQLLETIDSPINGHITVERDLALGTYIRANKLTQSGSIVRIIWSKTLRRVKNNNNFTPKNCLILGLGGGSIAKIVTNIWPQTKIIGIDLDPIMVNLGKKYMGLDKIGIEIHIQDALSFVKKQKKDTFDLICIDTYQGDEFPEKFESEKFLKIVKKILSINGLAVFNRLYYGQKKPEAIRFQKKLEKVFNEVNPTFPEANVLFICSSHF